MKVFKAKCYITANITTALEGNNETAKTILNFYNNILSCVNNKKYLVAIAKCNNLPVETRSHAMQWLKPEDILGNYCCHHPQFKFYTELKTV